METRTKIYGKNKAKNSLQIDFSKYMNIAYYKGALFDNVKVITSMLRHWLSMQPLKQNFKVTKTCQKPAKNPLKIPHAKTPQG